jgi:DNA-binding transcriptional LysR family regulator
MPASKTSMPPFPALRAFHAAARHGRFRDAARELAVTESAISHQVRRLEDFLRVQLFDRNGPRVRLTSAGARYFADVDPAMARIAEATRVLMGPVERQRVALTLPPSLAILWLIPNLGGFEQACPGIDLQLVTTTRLCDLRREQIDLAIRYGRGPWPDVEAEFLLGETATPVCRPGYLELEPAVGVTTVLKSCRLIVNCSNRRIRCWLPRNRVLGSPWDAGRWSTSASSPACWLPLSEPWILPTPATTCAAPWAIPRPRARARSPAGSPTSPVISCRPRAAELDIVAWLHGAFTCPSRP